jgi:hypothetical protein
MLGFAARKSPMRDHPFLNAGLVAAGLAVAVALFPSAKDLEKQVREANPSAAVNYIRNQGLTGPMLNDYDFGGYLIWAAPEHRVFIDGRADVYDWAGIFPEYGRWSTLTEDPKLLLDKYHIGFCILHKGAPMGRVIPYLPGWRKTYSDNVAEVFVR